MSDNIPFLKVKKLSVRYRTTREDFSAVSSVSFDIQKGKTFGLIGESGSGKSSVGKAILRLIPSAEGSVFLNGQPVHGLQPKNMQMIFQNPYGALNPRMTVRKVLEEALDIHALALGEERKPAIKQLLEYVHISDTLLTKYPRELSGGQLQRIVIARALAVEPQFIFCDEPTSSLDAHHEVLIIDLLVRLQKELGITYLFVSHNLPLVRWIADEIGVMYRGEIVERGSSEDLRNPKHPYTRSLLQSVPIADPRKERERMRKVIDS